MTEEEALQALKGDDPGLATTAEAFLWSLWCRSGDPEVDRIFRAGVEAMQQRKLDEAETLFTRVIELAPGFAEGWNKRATVRYLRKDFTGSIADCGETLGRNQPLRRLLRSRPLPYVAPRIPEGGYLFPPRPGNPSSSRGSSL